MGLGTGVRVYSSVGDAVYVPQFRTFLDYAESQAFTLPSPQMRIYQNSLMRGLVSTGLWSKITGMIVMATDNTDMAKINWKTPGTNDAQEGGTPAQLDFKAYIGYASNGVAADGNITLDCGAMSRSNIGCTVYINTVENTPAGGVKWPRSGVEVNWGCWQEARSLTDNELIRLPGSDNTGLIQHTNKVVTMVNTTGNAHTVYEDGVQIISGTGTGTSAPPNVHNPVDGYNGYMPFYIGHEWLNATEAATLANLLNAYLGNIGYGQVRYDSNYKTVLARTSGLNTPIPSSSVRDVQNELVLDLKSSGIWDSADDILVFAHDGNENFGRYNWVDPTVFRATLVNSPTFTSNVGFTGNGTTSYIDTNFTPSTDGNQFTQNAASVTVRMSSVTPANQFYAGAWDSSSNRISSRLFDATEYRFRINAAGLEAHNFSSADGVWHVNRDSSGSSDVFLNGVLADSSTNSSTGLPAQSIFLLAQNSSGSPMLYSSGTISICIIGGNLKDKASDLYEIINNYMNSI